MDLHQLEHQILHDKALQTKENWLALANSLYDQYKCADAKTKYKMANKVGFHFYQAYLAGDNTKDDYEFFIKTLQELKYEPRRLSKIIGDYMIQVGGEPETIVTKQGWADVESGTLAVYDSGYVHDFNLDPTDQNLLKLVNQGKALYWGTGGDGEFDITLRCTNGTEPVASPKEYRVILSSTPPAIIAIPSGKVIVNDILADGANKVEIQVPAGNYKVQVHHKDIPDRYYGYVVVLCPTTQDAKNSCTEISGLE